MSAKTNISARIDRMVDSVNSKVKAVASVTIGGAFAVHGIKVIDSQKGSHGTSAESVESCGDASAAWTTERNTVPNPSQWTSKPSKEPS